MSLISASLCNAAEIDAGVEGQHTALPAMLCLADVPAHAILLVVHFALPFA